MQRDLIRRCRFLSGAATLAASAALLGQIPEISIRLEPNCPYDQMPSSRNWAVTFPAQSLFDAGQAGLG
jgi:ABC-type antimicrobial peptide transport system ATPase subunit